MKRKLAFLFVFFISFVSGIYADTNKEAKVNALIVTDTACSYCDIGKAQETVLYYFPKAEFRKVDYRSKEGKAAIEKYKAQVLPLVVLPGSIKQDTQFKSAEDKLSVSGGDFLLKTEQAGMFMFLNRPYAANRVDYFFDFYDKRTDRTYPLLRSFCDKRKIGLNIHIIVPTKSVLGYPQQEVKSALAVRKIYPERFFDYLYERIKSIETIDCTTSLGKLGMDFKPIFAQFDTKDMANMLESNMLLARELGITNGNAILVNNQKLFMIFNAEEADFAKVISER